MIRCPPNRGQSSNPLGFLAAVGTLVVLAQGGNAEARLWWKVTTTWTPVLAGVPTAGEEQLSRLVANALTGSVVSTDDERRCANAKRTMLAARRALATKTKELRRGRRGRHEPHGLRERTLRPFENNYRDARQHWLQTLRRAVSYPELALGTRIDCTPDEYRDRVTGMLRGATCGSRGALDLLAAFGSDGCRRKDGVIEPTPFCFITGSGHQDFLNTVQELIGKVTPARVREVLFRPWAYRDVGLSMRWDPVEDKRYALLDADPGDAGARTVWMANLLAYRALALFPAVPTGGGLGTTGWNRASGSRAFSWPLWQYPASLDSTRSLLQLTELTREHPDARHLRARGVAAVYRSQRIEIGARGKQKVNFTPARLV
jgi:hypothetical protein